jgi:hypothetical protein
MEVMPVLQQHLGNSDLFASKKSIADALLPTDY